MQGNSKSIEETKNNAASSDNSTNFIYLTQTESCLPAYLLHPDIFGYPRKNDVLVLSWQRPCAEENSTHFKHIKYIHKAKSSWSEGRNILYRFAKEMPKNYLYCTFMHDVIFDFSNFNFSERYSDLRISSPLQAFEDLLLEHEPAIGVPVYCYRRNGPDCGFIMKLKPIPEYMFVTIWFDAIFTAFHRNASDLMLPYRLDYEQVSWWQSQKSLYSTVSNNAHRRYPKREWDNWTHLYNILKNRYAKAYMCLL